MKKATFSHRVEFAILLAVIHLLRALPLWVASGMMGKLWRIVAPKLSRQKRAMTHLRICFPHKSEEELYAITLGMWENLGRTFAEGLLAEKFLENAASLMEIPEDIDDLVAEMQQFGGVIVSLHSGNWELGGVISTKHDFNCSVVIQRMKNPLVHDYMVASRASTFRGGVFSKGEKAAVRIASTIKGGTIAAIMGDLRDRRGVLIPFFGQPAPTNTFPARLCRQTGAPLVAVRILRKEGIQFKVDVERIDVPNTENVDEDILEATTRVQAVFERWIRAQPEQWMWAHKRWG